ncbi:MAG: RNB domain-containing ribonuclease, partial [Planctomycetota bacterium]
MSATQIVAELDMPDIAARQLAVMLRELAEEGQLVEARPGRFLVAGADGEYQVTVADDGQGALLAVFPDGSERPIHPRHHLAAGPGDTAVGLVNQAGEVLLVRLLRRAGQELLGTLQFKRNQVILIPDRRREGALPVVGGNPAVLVDYQSGDRVVARVVRDSRDELVAEPLRILDEASPEVADFEQVRLVHDLPGEFPTTVQDTVAAMQPAWNPTGRRDCRDDCVFTIDPDTAKDFDDAIAVQRLRDGWRVAVHIADVSAFVPPGSELDAEAALRGTSVYLVNRVIPMLPEAISNGWCSLVPDEERYALAVFIELDRKLRVRSCEPAQTLIRSRCRLTYAQAQ